jgi:hypothetical protein
MAMQNDAFQQLLLSRYARNPGRIYLNASAITRFLRGPLFTVCAGACCFWAGVLQAADTATPGNPTIKNTQEIAAELDRETNLQAQMDRTLGPVTAAIKETVAGAHRIKQRYRAGTPEYGQARDLYAHVRQNIGRLEGQLTSAVQTVKQEDRGETAGRADKQVISDLNDALQKFDDLVSRIAPAPSPEQPSRPAPPPPPQAGEPAGQPTPPGLAVQPVQPEQYVQAQPQAGLVSAEVVVQVCNLFVEHAVGLGDRSAENIRGQMIQQIRRRVSLPAFGGT